MQTETNNTQVRIEESTIERQIEGSKSAAAVEVRDIRTVTFGPAGEIQSIQDERRTTGHVQLDESRERSSGISVTQQADSSVTIQTQQAKETIQNQANTDSRPVQGSEWRWFTIPAALASLIAFIILFFYFKRKLK